jgi:hypothetical protein
MLARLHGDAAEQFAFDKAVGSLREFDMPGYTLWKRIATAIQHLRCHPPRDRRMLH